MFDDFNMSVQNGRLQFEGEFAEGKHVVVFCDDYLSAYVDSDWEKKVTSPQFESRLREVLSVVEEAFYAECAMFETKPEVSEYPSFFVSKDIALKWKLADYTVLSN